MTLDEARKKIPSFNCDKGCSECCGPVPWSMEEFGRLPVAEQESAAKDTPEEVRRRGGLCVFWEPGIGCRVYDERPLMCRFFGAVEDLQCPKGYGPKQTLTRKEAHIVLISYYKKEGSHALDQ